MDEPAESCRRAPLISHRISFRFLPDPPAEPTSTLVLNAGGRDALYTDFRPLLADPSQCDWAFAGTKVFLPNGAARWTRLVDSRGPSSIPDEGVCETLPDGDELERGEMLDPSTGVVGRYEERWRDEHVPSGARVQALVSHDAERPGVWVRVGHWAQGVCRDPAGAISACRWAFDGEKWQVQASCGPSGTQLPIPNDNLTNEAKGWTVEENYIHTGAI